MIDAYSKFSTQTKQETKLILYKLCEGFDGTFLCEEKQKIAINIWSFNDFSIIMGNVWIDGKWGFICSFRSANDIWFDAF